jgi:hypothetical protein
MILRSRLRALLPVAAPLQSNQSALLCGLLCSSLSNAKRRLCVGLQCAAARIPSQQTKDRNSVRFVDASTGAHFPRDGRHAPRAHTALRCHPSGIHAAQHLTMVAT